jgi:hypothetical protein
MPRSITIDAKLPLDIHRRFDMVPAKWDILGAVDLLLG